MRLAAFAVLAACFSETSALAQAPTPQELIERAIKAQVEKPEDLLKRRIERCVMAGKLFDQPVTREIVAEWPARVRVNSTFTTPQGERRVNFALNGNSGWVMQPESGLQEFDFNRVDEFRSEIHGRWVATLLPFKDGKFTFASMAENRVNDEEVYVIKASMRFRPEVLLFFSKKSGLLRKVSYKTTEEGTAVRKEHVFSDYRKFDGLLLPGKMTDYQNGNVMVDYTIRDYKFLDKQPVGTFDKPSGK